MAVGKNKSPQHSQPHFDKALMVEPMPAQIDPTPERIELISSEDAPKTMLARNCALPPAGNSLSDDALLLGRFVALIALVVDLITPSSSFGFDRINVLPCTLASARLVPGRRVPLGRATS